MLSSSAFGCSHSKQRSYRDQERGRNRDHADLISPAFLSELELILEAEFLWLEFALFRGIQVTLRLV